METNSTARKRKSPTFSFTLSPELRERIAKASELEGRTPGNLARLAIETYLTSKGL